MIISFMLFLNKHFFNYMGFKIEFKMYNIPYLQSVLNLWYLN
jgi:hypothetical protein